MSKVPYTKQRWADFLGHMETGAGPYSSVVSISIEVGVNLSTVQSFVEHQFPVLITRLQPRKFCTGDVHEL